jgi:hypothetical protein
VLSRDFGGACGRLLELPNAGERLRPYQRQANTATERAVAAATARAHKITQAILAKAFRGELVPTEAELARQEGRAYEPRLRPRRPHPRHARKPSLQAEA